MRVSLLLVLLLACSKEEPSPEPVVTATPMPTVTTTTTPTPTVVTPPPPNNEPACRNNTITALSVIDSAITKYGEKVVNNHPIPNSDENVPSDYADHDAWVDTWIWSAFQHYKWMVATKDALDEAKTHLDAIKDSCLELLAKTPAGEKLLCKTHVITAVEKIEAVARAYDTDAEDIPKRPPRPMIMNIDRNSDPIPVPPIRDPFTIQAVRHIYWAEAVVSKMPDADRMLKFIKPCLKDLSQR